MSDEQVNKDTDCEKPIRSYGLSFPTGGQLVDVDGGTNPHAATGTLCRKVSGSAYPPAGSFAVTVRHLLTSLNSSPPTESQLSTADVVYQGPGGDWVMLAPLANVNCSGDNPTPFNNRLSIGHYSPNSFGIPTLIERHDISFRGRRVASCP